MMVTGAAATCPGVKCDLRLMLRRRVCMHITQWWRDVLSKTILWIDSFHMAKAEGAIAMV